MDISKSTPRTYFNRSLLVKLKGNVSSIVSYVRERIFGPSSIQRLILNRVNSLRGKGVVPLTMRDVIFLERVDGKAIYLKVTKELAHGYDKVVFPLFKLNLTNNSVRQKVEICFRRPSARIDFGRENQIALQFKGSQNIVKAAKLVKVGNGQRVWIQKRYGDSLADQIIDEKITKNEHLPIARRICAGLKALHDAGLVHRDLKPDNIFGKGIVGDLGFTCLKTKMSGDKGTWAYRAPEGNFDFPADIWGLGQVFYCMTTGRAPIEREEMQYLDDDLSKVNPKLACVIKACLNLNPKKRPTIDQVIASLKA